MEQRKICGVTGGSGFIGTHLCRELIKLGHKVLNIDRQTGYDITEELPEEKFDIIFHLAAKHHIPTGERLPREFIDTNIWGTVNLIRKYPNSRIILASSSAANEIKSVYGLTKKACEISGNLHKNFLSVRFYNVFGDGQTLELSPAIAKFVNCFINKLDLTIYGDGEQKRDFTYVGDLVPALINVAFSDRKGIAHLGYGEPVSVNKMIELIYGSMPKITYLPARTEDILFSKSPESIPAIIGREEGLRRTIKWARESL